MLETDNFDFLIAGLIDAADDAHDPRNIGRAIRNDEHVGSRMRCEVAVLWYQRTQNWHELSGTDVLNLKNLGDHVIGACGALCADRTCELPSRCVRDDLDDVAGTHRNKAMHLQDRKERLVKSIR